VCVCVCVCVCVRERESARAHEREREREKERERERERERLEVFVLVQTCVRAVHIVTLHCEKHDRNTLVKHISKTHYCIVGLHKDGTQGLCVDVCVRSTYCVVKNSRCKD
jgi:hypothetical protein